MLKTPFHLLFLPQVSLTVQSAVGTEEEQLLRMFIDKSNWRSVQTVPSLGKAPDNYFKTGPFEIIQCSLDKAESPFLRVTLSVHFSA